MNICKKRLYILWEVLKKHGIVIKEMKFQDKSVITGATLDNSLGTHRTGGGLRMGSQRSH